MCRYGWRLMRGKTKSPLSLNSFSKNSRCSCDCPIKLLSHLLAAYPRSVGGLEGRLRLGVWGVMPRSCENRPMMGTSSAQIFFSSAPSSHIFHRLPERAATPTPSIFCHDSPFFSWYTRPSLHWHCHNFSLSRYFLSRPTQRNTFLKSHQGKEPASFKLSTKSKLYVHDMSEAVLTALSVCSASAKPIVVFVSFSSFTLFLLPREKLSVLPALKKKRGLREKEDSF